MFNAKRSALYIALIGAALVAGEASAACSPSARVNGVLVCMKGTPGSFVCDVQAQLDPACLDGGEGCDFGDSAFNRNSDLTSACSYTGAVVNPDDFTALNLRSYATLDLRSFETLLSAGLIKTASPNNDQRNGPKKFKCNNGYLVGFGKRVPCSTTASDGGDLWDGASQVDTLPADDPPPIQMSCSNNGVCKSTQEILPTGLTCGSDGPPAIDYTPAPDSSFIVKVEIQQDGGEGGVADAYFGCNGSAGGGYNCEAISEFNTPEFACGSGINGGFGDTSGNLYCESGDLPPGELICQQNSST